MNFNFIIAQIFGVFAFFTGILSYYRNNAKEVIFYNGLCNFFCCIQYMFLGAYTGALCCIIATTRNIVFSRFKKDIPLIYLVLFLIVLILTNFKLVNSVIDVIPIINVFLYSIALWTKDIFSIKKMSFVACVDGVIYNIFKGAYVGILYETVFGIAVVKSYLELIKEKRLKK